VDLVAARQFVEGHHRAVLATRRHDGSPQLSPVVCALDERGHVVVSTRETAAKTANIRRDPRVSICVLTDSFFGEWVQIDGSVEVVALPEAMDGLVDYYRAIAGEHPDWDEYRDSMNAEQRVLLVVTPERAGPDRHG
jgi:PPOX class probable F420-dependent enzyme